MCRTDTVAPPPRSMVSPPRTSIVGSSSPEMTACAAARWCAGPSGILQVVVAHAAVEVDVGLAAAQQVRVCLVDDDLGLASGHLPQRVRPADVVDVAVGEEDPADVLDPAAERRRGPGPCRPRARTRCPCRRSPARGASMRKLYRWKRPQGDASGWIGTVAVMTARSRTGRPARTPRSTRGSRRSAGRSRASRPGTG